MTQLCDTRRVEDFDSICEVGNNFAENYDFSDEFISGIREKFEEAEELTWKSFEATMDEIIGPFVDQVYLFSSKNKNLTTSIVQKRLYCYQ